MVYVMRTTYMYLAPFKPLDFVTLNMFDEQ
jgi:hypothetical protein